MAILRKSEIKEMGPEELEDKMSQLKADLMKIRGVLASGGIPENVGRAREIKKTIARIKTMGKQVKVSDKKTKK